MSILLFIFWLPGTLYLRILDTVAKSLRYFLRNINSLCQQDELLWGAAWLYKASGSEAYLRYILTNNEELGGTTESPPAFSWDNKYAGAQVLLATVGLCHFLQ